MEKRKKTENIWSGKKRLRIAVCIGSSHYIDRYGTAKEMCIDTWNEMLMNGRMPCFGNAFRPWLRLTLKHVPELVQMLLPCKDLQR